VRERRYRNRFRGGRSIYFLPPAVAALAAGAYYLPGEHASYDDYVDTFMAPPVFRLERRYTLDEVVANPEIRSAMRSIDLSMVRFKFGSDQIPDDQFHKLENLADAIRATIAERPNEVFLIEGHTDAVGSQESNLELSERRAVTVLEILISEFGIPAKNLESVGYGKQYLLIETDQREARNRRVVVRAIGALLAKRG
jgi:OmpA-OmpF porin, OOP family